MWEVDFKKGEHCNALLSTAAARRAAARRKGADFSANARTNLLTHPQGFYGVIQRL